MFAASMFALAAMAGWACGGDDGGNKKLRACDEFGEESEECEKCVDKALPSCSVVSCASSYQAVLACMQKHGCDMEDELCLGANCMVEAASAFECLNGCMVNRCGESIGLLD